MKYRTMCDEKVSLLGFGCMRFPLDKKGGIDCDAAEKMIDLAIKEGVNYFDTAYPYHNGESEPFVGRVLDKYPRDSYLLATKLPIWLVKSRKQAEEIFYNQLERLNKDYVDFYLLHAMNEERWELALELGLVELFEELQKAGKIKHLGFSFHDSYEVFEKMLMHRKWDFCQIQFNYMDTNIQAGIRGYSLAESLGVPIVVMEPVKGGSLATLPEDISCNFRRLAPDLSDASWALRFVGGFENVKVVLSGMSTPQQLSDNLETFADFRAFDEAESAMVEVVRNQLEERTKNGCTGCGYCMPCPFGVNIPECFSAWNDYGKYSAIRIYQRFVNFATDEGERPHNCKECGKCEKVCPQGISIRENLKSFDKELNAVLALAALEDNKAELIKNNASLLFIKNQENICLEGRGVKPVIEKLEEDMDFFKNTAVLDKVVGKAVAMLFALSGVKAVYALTISRPALEVLEKNGIPVKYDNLVPFIENRDKSGACPMESAVMGIEDNQSAFEVLKAKVKEFGGGA